MTLNLALLIGMVVLYACGIYLLLERSLTRMLLGFLLVGNATNILVFFTSGAFGLAPLWDPDAAPESYSDPLPQAFILTAIVITFGVTAFLLALIYRSWRLAQADTVEDDEEDVAMRSIDPTADDEEFDEDDAGDTEFGTFAEAAVSTANPDVGDIMGLSKEEIEEHLREYEQLLRAEADRVRAARDAHAGRDGEGSTPPDVDPPDGGTAPADHPSADDRPADDRGEPRP